MTSSMHAVTRFAVLAVGGLALVVATRSAAAAICVYQLPGGSRIIADHPLTNRQYKLIRCSVSVKGMGALVAARNPAALLADPRAYHALIERTARRYRMDPALIKAMVHAESGFDPQAVSPRGALGLMQLMPATARRYGARDVFDPRQNVRAGVLYMRDLLKRFRDNRRLALAAYNAGENAVLKYKGVPPYAETRAYVKKVLGFHRLYVPPTKLAAR